MQVIINIPERIYKRQGYLNIIDSAILRNALKDGKPLPKGHGRLIDADELKTLTYEVFLDTDNPNRADGLTSVNGIAEEDIDYAPTIIEADKDTEI